MAGGNSTINCSYAAPEITCDAHMASSIDKSLGEKMWLMNSLLLISAVLAGVIVGIGIYGQRYSHHRCTRLPTRNKLGPGCNMGIPCSDHHDQYQCSSCCR
uniref:Uncharacterized protein n=1 Tax=Setaria viridis TaxID=4556 RepID=A0A4U6VL17_SETVI|nr:hypothetical protein SEVIR_2G029632v2 [Setaria viridis]